MNRGRVEKGLEREREEKKSFLEACCFASCSSTNYDSNGYNAMFYFLVTWLKCSSFLFGT